MILFPRMKKLSTFSFIEVLFRARDGFALPPAGPSFVVAADDDDDEPREASINGAGGGSGVFFTCGGVLLLLLLSITRFDVVVDALAAFPTGFACPLRSLLLWFALAISSCASWNASSSVITLGPNSTAPHFPRTLPTPIPNAGSDRRPLRLDAAAPIVQSNRYQRRRRRPAPHAQRSPAPQPRDLAQEARNEEKEMSEILLFFFRLRCECKKEMRVSSESMCVSSCVTQGTWRNLCMYVCMYDLRFTHFYDVISCQKKWRRVHAIMTHLVSP